ncbi:MAG: hypothetical protein WC284_17250 [Candidimonas sp.]
MADDNKTRKRDANGGWNERFISDGGGLTFDNSEAEGEPFDFSPWVEGEDDAGSEPHKKPVTDKRGKRTA